MRGCYVCITTMYTFATLLIFVDERLSEMGNGVRMTMIVCVTFYASLLLLLHFTFFCGKLSVNGQYRRTGGICFQYGIIFVG